MKTQEFDRLVAEIRETKIEPEAAEMAANRVWERISGSGATVAEILRFRNCGEFEALIPGYLSGALSDARRFLLEDHMHECVACRKTLEAARGVAGVRRPEAISRVKRPPVLQWAMAAALVVCSGLGAFGAANGLLPGQHAVRARVYTTTGSLYLISDEGATLLKPGKEIRDGDEVRTRRGSKAVVRLADGTLVEMGERADLSVTRGWRGTTIHLDRGPVLVQAAKQRFGRLYVSTDDCRVSVKGTIFSVNQGTQGSRVSVIEGTVQVEQGQQEKMLYAGDQTTTSMSLAAVPIHDEIAWSSDASKYFALLDEFTALRRQLGEIQQPGLRFRPDFLDRLPPDTVIYGAIPNLGQALGEAGRVFETRLRESAVLRDWWNQQQSSRGPTAQDLIKRVQTLTGYLGEEIVLSVGFKGTGRYRPPVVMAEVHQAGLRSFLESQLAEHPGDFQLVDSLAALKQGEDHRAAVYVDDRLVAASNDAAELQRTVSTITGQTPAAFGQTAFGGSIAQSYRNGAGWLLAADMEQIAASSVKGALQDVRYLMIERRETGGSTENRASLSFAPERSGIASWLAAPGPMGSLEFVSPKAFLAFSFVINNPRSALDELLQMAGATGGELADHIAQFQSKTGVSVRDEIAAALGGEMTFAIDGPLLPVPSWKVIFEVDDPALIAATIGKLVEGVNRELPAEAGRIILTQQQIGSRTFFTLSMPNHPGIQIDYTFADSYLVAASSMGLLQSAIQNRETGYTLTRSASFRNELPGGSYTNFSGILYHNLGAALGGLAEQLKNVPGLSDEQKQFAQSFRANSSPGLICLYGEPNRIVVASRSGFMGFNLDTLLAVRNRGFLELPHLFQGVTNMGNARISTQ